MFFLAIPPTYSSARYMARSSPTTCLCYIEHASALLSLRALFARVAERLCALHGGSAAAGEDTAYPHAARALWWLLYASLTRRARQQRGEEEGDGLPLSSGEAVPPGPPVLAVAPGPAWACAAGAEARLLHRLGRRRLSHWVRAGSPSAQAAPPWRPGHPARRCASTLTLLLTLHPAVLRCLPPASHRLLHSQRAVQALRDTVAMVSTLGGGYFLVKDIGRAVALAKRQAWLAARLGDAPLWRASSLHLVYIAIQVGAWGRGLELIEQLREGAALAGDGRALAQLSAAQGYLAQTREWAEAGRLSEGGDAHRQALARVEEGTLALLCLQPFRGGEEEEEEEEEGRGELLARPF